MPSSAVSMTEGPIWKKMTAFTLPILLGHMFQQLYNAVDSIIVGNFLGSNALAAVSSSGSLIFMLIGFLMGVAIGAGVVVSRYFGAKDKENLHRAVHTTVGVGLVLGAVMTAVGVYFTPRILKIMGTPAEVMPDSVSYLQLYFAGAYGFVMYNIFVGILQAVGDSKHPLYYLIASSVTNLILDLLLIGVFKTGVWGAAAATVFSQFLSASLCLKQLLTTKDDYRLSIRDIGFESHVLKDIVRIGLPSGIQNSLIAFSNLVVQSYINMFGSMAMAGYGAYAKVEGFVFMPITSFNMALTTFVGQNLGAKKPERTRKGAVFGILSAVIAAETIGAFMYIFAPQLIAAFNSNSEVIMFGVQKSRVCSLFFCLLAFTHSVSAVLRGAGKATVPMIVMIAVWCVIRVTFLKITIPMTHNILMLCWVYPLTWAISSLILFIYYKKARWM